MSDSSNEDSSSPAKRRASPSIGENGSAHDVTVDVEGRPVKVSIPVMSHNGGTGKDLNSLPDDYSEEEDDGTSSDEEELVQSKSKREKILEFFNIAEFEEVMRMPRCKEKKAELIISLRPFYNWDDLRIKFDGHRVLGPETIENCRELIEIRQVVLDLMERCEKISERLTHHVNLLTTTSDLGSCHIKEQPSLINPKLKLKPYQLIGINWLLLMYQQKVDGILADEMGLGKTSQSIAFLAYLLEQGNVGPHLIIVPSSTLENWAVELRRWCPALKFITYHGSMEDRRYLRSQIFMEQGSYHVILSTYNVLTSTIDDKQIYKKIKFQYTILDEAHLLKNMTSQRYQNLMKIQAVRRLLLTGTPFQNDLVELMSLLCFVMPNMFINKEAQLKKMFTSISRKTDINGKTFEASRILHAKNIMKPFVLRRLKVDVLKDLPTKHHVVAEVTMCPAQQKLYSSLASRFSSDKVELGKMDAITQLRFTANHHLLLRNHYTDGKLRRMAKLILTEPDKSGCSEEYVYEDMQVMNDFELHRLCKSMKSIEKYSLTDEDILSSGKFQHLDTVLPQIKEKGEKVLIFTQYKLILDILEHYLKSRGHAYHRLDGSTPVSERLSMIEDFNNDDKLFVFILSTRAGGLGINLTSANHVIIHDIDWNPHNDRQAEDRSHRLGQEREVKVTRLISKGTIEVAMLAQATRKLELEKEIHVQDGKAEEDVPDAVTLLNESLSLWTHNQ
ncbi:SWI/SNF-related matrix-associated actin-dependent regulator of chromatin subfamily A containing DEAD/H box 1-like [Watersipora subatra]|uniref:SWI/SNF-related matrix-associated actin-dependent regulator of chromatin subfamily A containing DEAD/H box 1-like n=1 Tax=Watersipora subatra TaxID=2589382 RepID=UPI00355C9CAD